ERHTVLITRLPDTLSAAFGDQLSRYAPTDRFAIPVQPGNYLHLDENIKFYNTVIVALTVEDLADRRLMQFISTQAVGKEIILVVFGDGTNLNVLDFCYFPILWSPDKTTASVVDAAMSVFGGLACTARLPQSCSPRYTIGAGYTTAKTRLAYTDASTLGIDRVQLETDIDHIMDEAIRERAIPGGVVMAVKGGQVIFEKSYGYHTYG